MGFHPDAFPRWADAGGRLRPVCVTGHEKGARMAEQKKKLMRTIWVLGAGFSVVVIVWALSIVGVIPLTFTMAGTPEALIKVLDSPRDDMRGVKINGHFLDIGKRRSLQIVKGYDEVMYLVRPYRQVRVFPRSLTQAELLDFCTNITGAGFDELRSRLESGDQVAAEWEGRIEGKAVRIVKASMFSYLVSGLMERPIFMTQVELAKRLGMAEPHILTRLIPVQKRWYEEFLLSSALQAPYPVHYIIPIEDELTAWLGAQAASLK